MQKLWYDYDEVAQFHPIIKDALNQALANAGYDDIAEVIHHPTVPNSTIVPDFGIRLKSNQRYVFIVEVKRSNRDVNSQRYQNQSRNYVTEFAPYWQNNYHKYFCVTNVERLILFADRQGPLSTCILKNNPKIHPPFQQGTHDAGATIAAFQNTVEGIFQDIFTHKKPDWDNNWLPIIDGFYQNFISLKGNLSYPPQTSEELSLYELFRLFAFVYLREFYAQHNSSNRNHFRGFPTKNDDYQRFTSRLQNSYSRILQLDFRQVFSNHPDALQRIFPENFSESTAIYFKGLIESLNNYAKDAVKDNPSPSYIFDLLTSRIYDHEQLHKKGKVMSDSELANLLAMLTIQEHTDKILDPGCGDGSLLDAAYDQLEYLAASEGETKTHNQLLAQTIGIEIDPFLAQLATFRLISKNLIQVDSNTQAHIVARDVFDQPRPTTFDVILMNPPFLRNDNKVAPITNASKQRMIRAIQNQGLNSIFEHTSQPNLYFYFVNYIWHYLNENSRAGIILMTKFLNNKEGEHLKVFLLDKIEAVISYPRDYFEGFSVTTVIIILAKQSGEQIKFLNILEPGLLENPAEIQDILQNNTTTIGTNYTLRVTDRSIDPSANWRRYLVDPEDKFSDLENLDFISPITDFFRVKRGEAANSGGSKIIYPNFSESPFSEIANAFRVSGIKTSRKERNYVLSNDDFEITQAILFPNFDENSPNGLPSNITDVGMANLYQSKSQMVKWKKIVTEAITGYHDFDILIPRNLRAKHACYFNEIGRRTVLSTNFIYLSDFKNGNEDDSISDVLQKKFIASYLLSSFGQIQHEIEGGNQEGTRKLEKKHIAKFKVLDVRQLTQTEMQTVTNAFDTLNTSQATFRGDEGNNTPRKDLDLAIGQIIFERNNLGFDNVEELVKFFQLFLAELVDERNPGKW